MSIQKIRGRLAAGEATEEDMTWARQGMKALEEWPDKLTAEQENELEWLANRWQPQPARWRR